MTRHKPRPNYTHWHILMASPLQPMPEAKRLHQLTRMWQGLAALETAANPTTDDWRVCSDAVNLLETLVLSSPIKVRIDAQHVDSYDVTDASGLLPDAIAALAQAGQRHMRGGQIRLDGPGIKAVRAVLEDYAALLATLPERAMVICHRQTEQRLQAIMRGKRQPHDVEVMAL